MQASSFLQMTVAEIGKADESGRFGFAASTRSCVQGRSAEPVLPARDDFVAGRRGRKPLRSLRGRNIRSLQERPVLSAPKAFIIHLERAAGRRASVEALRARLPIESEILPAVDGRARLAEADRGGLCARSRFSPRYPFALGLPEIGAFLSHRAAWRRIVDEGLDFAFVFEDDAAIDAARVRRPARFRGRRARPLDLRAPAGGGAGAVPARRRPRRGEFALLRPHSPPLQGDRTDRFARGRRASACAHRAFRPAGRHLSADGLGDWRDAAGRDPDARSATCRARPAGPRCSAGGWAFCGVCIMRRCGPSIGRRSWRGIGGILRSRAA